MANETTTEIQATAQVPVAAQPAAPIVPAVVPATAAVQSVVLTPPGAPPTAPVSTVKKASDFTKHQAWKWIGSMFMETKTDPTTGEQHLVLGLTRIMATVLFTAMMVLWLKKTEIISSVQVPDIKSLLDPIPNSMLYTFWSLLGLKGINTVSEAVKVVKNSSSDTAV
jgi:hypothetical protein